MRTLARLDGQFDEIRLCLNNYEYIPEPLKKYTCVIPTTNLTDNGKFYFLNDAHNEYYFTCDDDIDYPKDYAAKTIGYINKYKSIITYHGRRLVGTNLNYYRGHKFFHCQAMNLHPQRLDVCGTGVTAFDTNYFKAKDLHLSHYKRMSDVVFSHAAMNKLIVLCPKDKDWIQPQDVNDCIYSSEVGTPQTNQINLSNEIYKHKYSQNV